jgi:ATP-dependent DNA helicase RecQ
MRSYAGGERCLMQVLTEALDDPEAGRCGRCSVCTGELPEPGHGPSAETVAAARTFLRGRVQILEPRKQWPSGSGRRGRISGLLPGRAVAFADDPAWREIAAELAGADREPSEELRQSLVRVLSRWAKEWERPVAVVPVPSRRCPQRVHGLAEHIAAVGRLPLVDALEVAGPAPNPDAASTGRVRHLLETLSVRSGQTLPEGPVLLVDDIARTRWTLTVAAALLLDAGASAVLPLVAHRLP